MPQKKQYEELYDHKEIKEFLKKYKLDKDKRYMRNYVSVIGRYLKHRKLSIKEYLVLLEKETEEEIEEVKKYRAHLKKIGKGDYTSYIRKFIRFKGITIPSAEKPKQNKKIMYFIDDVEDKYMVEFMELQQGLSENSRRKINRSLYEFCKYFDLTPTKLYDQVERETLGVKQIGRMIIDFSHSRENPNEEEQKKFGWKKISLLFAKTKVYYVNQFFEMVCLVKPIFRTRQLGQTDNGMTLAKRGLIIKEEIKQVSERMTLQQKCLLFGLYESGLYASDLTQLTFGEIKHKINFKVTLEKTEDCVAFFNRRGKSKVGHIAVIGKQTLYYLQQKLSERIRMYSHEEPYQIQDDELVFSENNSVNRKLNSGSISTMIRDKVLSCGLEKFTSRDLRRTFVTLLAESAKIPIEHRQILYGHTNKLMSARAYTISDFPKYEEFYLRSYFECFFLEYTDVKYKTLRNRTESQEEDIRELRKELEDSMKPILEDLISKMENQTKTILEMQEREQERYQQEENEAMQEWQEEKKQIEKKLKKKTLDTKK